MQFENQNIRDLISQFKTFSVEGFNIFAQGQDDLPHLICACPNKHFARAIQSLLTIAKQAHNQICGDAEGGDLVVPSNESTSVLQVYEDTVMTLLDPGEEFPH